MKLAAIAVLVMSTSAFARDVPKPSAPPEKPPVVKTFNIGPLELGGKVRVLAMLEFMERANEELQRSALEKKSFLPKIVASLEEAAL